MLWAGLGGDGLNLILLGIRGATILLVKNTGFDLLLCRKDGEAGVLFVRHEEAVEGSVRLAGADGMFDDTAFLLDSFSCEDDKLIVAGCVWFLPLTGRRTAGCESG